MMGAKGEGDFGGDPMGGAPVFDGAMDAMDTAASANMADGMEAANTAADASDAAAAGAGEDAPVSDDVA